MKHILILILCCNVAMAQKMKPEETEVWSPVPPVVTAASISALAPPSDAIVLFDGLSLDKWEKAGADDKSEPAGWTIAHGELIVKPGEGAIATRQSFGSVQLHIEWLSPVMEGKSGQGWGNSGIFFMGRYEIQVLNSYKNKTYSNGQAGSIYKQHIPLVNASNPPGEWQSYDIVFNAPVFNADGSLMKPATLTAFHNGVLIQNNVELKGPTEYIGHPSYKAHPDRLPLVLQDHSDPVRFRNIWIREL